MSSVASCESLRVTSISSRVETDSGESVDGSGRAGRGGACSAQRAAAAAAGPAAEVRAGVHSTRLDSLRTVIVAVRDRQWKASAARRGENAKRGHGGEPLPNRLEPEGGRTHTQRPRTDDNGVAALQWCHSPADRPQPVATASTMRSAHTPIALRRSTWSLSLRFVTRQRTIGSSAIAAKLVGARGAPKPPLRRKETPSKG